MLINWNCFVFGWELPSSRVIGPMRIANADENDRGPFPSPIYTLPTKGALCVHGPVEAPTLIGTAPCFVGKQYSEDRSILEPFEVERKAETYAFPSGRRSAGMYR